MCLALNLQDYCGIFRRHSTSNTSERLQGVRAAILQTTKQDHHPLVHYTWAVYMSMRIGELSWQQQTDEGGRLSSFLSIITGECVSYYEGFAFALYNMIEQG